MSGTSFSDASRARVDVAAGLGRLLEMAAAIRPDEPSVWAEAQTYYEVAGSLAKLFQTAATKPEREETEAEIAMRFACHLAARRIRRAMLGIEQAWIQQYPIPHVGNAPETTNVVEMRNAA